MAGGGVSAQQITPLTWQQAQPQIGQAYNFQQNQYGQAIANNPLLSTAGTGALNFYNTEPGLAAPLQSAESYYSGIVNSGGAAPAADVRDINQSTLANADAAGSAFSPSTLGAEAINEQAFREQRMAQATGEVGQLSSEQQGLQTGALGQLLNTASSQVGTIGAELNPILGAIMQIFGINAQEQIANQTASLEAAGLNQSANSGLFDALIGGLAKVGGAAIGTI
jgi:hypothetical protein